MSFKSDIEIAQLAEPKPITEIANDLEIEDRYVECYGRYKAKIDYNLLDQYKETTNGRLILVTAINPTPAGEGENHYNCWPWGCIK